MSIVRVIYIFIIGLIYGVFKSDSINEYSITNIVSITIGFMITSFIFAAIIYLVSMIFITNNSEIEQSDDIILDEEYTNQITQSTTNFEQFTKYWLIVGIVIFLIMMLNTFI